MKRLHIILTLILFVLFSLAGCATVHTHRNLEQPTDTILTTGIGGTIFRLNKTGDLPNAFGGRDIYGGKVDKGFAEMKLAGINGTVLILEITEVNKQSSETTMDRYKPFNNPTAAVNVTVDNSIAVGNQNSTKPYSINFDTTKQSDIVISGIRVNFTEIQPYSVRYTLKNMHP